MKRRWFTAMLGATPFATSGNIGMTAQRQIDLLPPLPPMMYGDTNMIQAATPSIEPRVLAGYNKALHAKRSSEELSQIISNASRGQIYCDISNITCLRSVAPQHQYRTAAQKQLDNKREEESFINKLRKKFGVLEYFGVSDSSNESLFS